MTASNPDERVKARVVARKLADELVDSFLSECIDEASKHSDWKVDFTEAFFDQLRVTINTINPPKDKQSPSVVTRQQRLPMTSPILIDQDVSDMPLDLSMGSSEQALVFNRVMCKDKDSTRIQLITSPPVLILAASAASIRVLTGGDKYAMP